MKFLFICLIFLYFYGANAVCQDMILKVTGYSGTSVAENKINFSKIFLGTSLFIYKKQTSPSLTGGIGADMGGLPNDDYIYHFPLWLGFTATKGEYAGAFVGAYYTPNYFIMERLQADLTRKNYTGIGFLGAELRAGVFYQDYSLSFNIRYNKTKYYRYGLITIGLEKNLSHFFERIY